MGRSWTKAARSLQVGLPGLVLLLSLSCSSASVPDASAPTASTGTPAVQSTTQAPSEATAEPATPTQAPSEATDGAGCSHTNSYSRVCGGDRRSIIHGRRTGRDLRTHSDDGSHDRLDSAQSG